MIVPEEHAPENPDVDMEMLAAFIDGRLSGQQKAAVEERLLRDEDFYDVYLAAVQFQQEEAASVQMSVKPRRRPLQTFVAVAAAVLLTVAISLFFRDRRPTTINWAAQLKAEDVVANADWSQPGWSDYRDGEAAGSQYTPEQLAFRMGVRSLDLEIAVATTDREMARFFAQRLVAMTHAANLFIVSSDYEELVVQLEYGDITRLLPLVDELRWNVGTMLGARALEKQYFLLGRWLETGRLAALAGDGVILYGTLHQPPELGIPTSIATEVETLRSLHPESKPMAGELEETLTIYTRVLNFLAG